jgi:hypothetical protein
MNIQPSMQRLGRLRGSSAKGAVLQGFGEGVEQAPHVTQPRMTRLDWLCDHDLAGVIQQKN